MDEQYKEYQDFTDHFTGDGEHRKKMARLLAGEDDDADAKKKKGKKKGKK